MYIKEKEICTAYIPKHNSTREKQIVILIIPNGEQRQRHYLSVKELPALFNGITLKHKDDFYYLNCLHSFRAENKLKSHETVYKKKDFCRILMPSEKDNIFEFNQYMKSNKMPYIIYADI